MYVYYYFHLMPLQVLGFESMGKCVTFLALPGYGLSCRINDVDFLKKDITSFSQPCRNLEVHVNGVVCDSDADNGMNRLLTGKGKPISYSMCQFCLSLICRGVSAPFLNSTNVCSL